ncbi:hypothetical protein PQX77_017260 [Marasmius sp. AFHP31]|nr:hypothetical protein PQX77_017260 [Marasmius sp. AFHP31]
MDARCPAQPSATNPVKHSLRDGLEQAASSSHILQSPPSLGYSYPPHIDYLSPHQSAAGIEDPSQRHSVQPEATQPSITHQPSSSTVTENFGNRNQTINGSQVYRDCSTAVFYVQFPNSSPSTPRMQPVPAFNLSAVPSNTVSASTSVVTAGKAPVVKIDDRTHGQRYTSLMLACKVGYPLWKPSPRCTDTGEKHAIKIGDVGICCDLDPFYTLFNITEPLGGVTNSDRVPDGVDPPCDIRGNMTVDDRYHQNGKLLSRPQGSVMYQISTEEDCISKTYTFGLTHGEGALLMLPHGGVLRKLQKTRELRKRITLHWRDWYHFADEEGDLDETQTLCLVTGVEQCSTWAMAGWDDIPSGSGNDPGSMILTVNENSGHSSWISCPPRCSTQSSEGALSFYGLSETVFLRAFWISNSNGSFNTRSSPPPPPGRSENHDNNGNPPERDRHLHGPFDNSKNSQNPFMNSSSLLQGLYSHSQPPPSDSKESTLSSSHSTFTLPSGGVDEPKIVRFAELDLEKIQHPCQLINKLAFELISKACPSLLDSGCAAFSHDDDWMSVINDVGDWDVLKGDEIIERVCRKFKFVAEGDVIYIESMTPAESACIMQQRSRTAALIPVLFHSRAVSRTDGASQTITSSTQAMSSEPCSQLGLEACHSNEQTPDSSNDREGSPAIHTPETIQIPMKGAPSTNPPALPPPVARPPHLSMEDVYNVQHSVSSICTPRETPRVKVLATPRILALRYNIPPSLGGSHLVGNTYRPLQPLISPSHTPLTGTFHTLQPLHTSAQGGLKFTSTQRPGLAPPI